MVGGPVHCNPQMVDAIVFHRIQSFTLCLSISLCHIHSSWSNQMQISN